MISENRNLFLGLAFAVATVLGWMWARDIYRERLAVVQSGGQSFSVTLKQVTQYRALFPDRSVEQWLGADKAHSARKQLRRYNWTFSAALLCGFFAVFSLGLHLEALRRDLLPAGVTS